ncbi:nucleotidyltransferase domain-containing protein [Nakamurella lactea]|uniref:nucleotidyltransferase domain-containing protein n=1 Tax=Nakamurella lactea TaxID=459515 RepID=UPI00048C7729|nr:nucleotidyltransferase domain-containing protein [Nakamurella lactea]
MTTPSGPVEHPIDPVVRRQVLATLDDVEREHDVRIVFACESGSRGWGFASPDSDYDVRFIFVHRLDWYLSVDRLRNVIELPINDVYDVNGWDLRKTLGLLKRGNATVMEWLNSPVVYRADQQFVTEIREVAQQVHRPERSFYHYSHMGRRHSRAVLDVDQVKLKKYLYALRSLLSARWVALGMGPAPMRFTELVDALVADQALRAEIGALLIRKRRAGEVERIVPLPIIDDFIRSEIHRQEQLFVPATPIDTAPLDQLLGGTVRRLDRTIGSQPGPR